MRPTPRSSAGSATGWSTDSGSTTRTAWPIRKATCAGSGEVTGGSYLLIEKILEPGEVLPAGFDCEGTTGYDALADVDRLFVDPAGQDALDALDAELRGGGAPTTRT